MWGTVPRFHFPAYHLRPTIYLPNARPDIVTNAASHSKRCSPKVVRDIEVEAEVPPT